MNLGRDLRSLSGCCSHRDACLASFRIHKLTTQASSEGPAGAGRYLARGPGELSVSQLHVQPELPLVDAAVLPLLYAPDQLDVGALQVLLPERALGLFFLLWGLREEPRERKGAGWGACCPPKVFRATESREAVLQPDKPRGQTGGCPCSPGRGTEAPGAWSMLRVTQEAERAVSVQLSDKAEHQSRLLCCCSYCLKVHILT